MPMSRPSEVAKGTEKGSVFGDLSMGLGLTPSTPSFRARTANTMRRNAANADRGLSEKSKPAKKRKTAKMLFEEEKAAKLKKEREEGQKKRKAFEKKRGEETARRRRLLLNI